MTEPSAATDELLTDAEIELIGFNHRASRWPDLTGRTFCEHDDETWPCNAVRLANTLRAARHAQQQADDRIRELESLLVRVHGLVYRMRTHHDVRAADEAHGIIVSARSSGTWTWGPQAAERDASSAERP